MAHDSQVRYDEERPVELGRDGKPLCPRCKGTGWPYREEMQRGGQFAGVVYSRSSPVRCSCQTPKEAA